MKYLSLFFGLMLTQTVFAIEESSVLDRYSVVGVISGSSESNKDVAVIKDRVTNRSLTVVVGTRFGEEQSLWVKDIVGKKVILSDGEKLVEIGYAHPSLQKPDQGNAYGLPLVEDEAQVERFIEQLSEAYEENLQEIEDEKLEESEISISDYAFQLLQKQRLDKTQNMLEKRVSSDFVDADADADADPNSNPNLEVVGEALNQELRDRDGFIFTDEIEEPYE